MKAPLQKTSRLSLQSLLSSINQSPPQWEISSNTEHEEVYFKNIQTLKSRKRFNYLLENNKYNTFRKSTNIIINGVDTTNSGSEIIDLMHEHRYSENYECSFEEDLNKFPSSKYDINSIMEYFKDSLEKIDTPTQYYGNFSIIEMVKLKQGEKDLASYAEFDKIIITNDDDDKKTKNIALLTKLFSKNKYTYSQQKDIINFANNLENSTEKKITLNDMNEINQSGRKDKSIIAFDCCPNGDHVYLFDDDKNHELQCPNCTLDRYSSCQHSTCNSRNSCKKIEHKKYKIPERQIFYRSVIMLLHDLCSSKLFRGLINYNKDEKEKSLNMYNDVMDSPHVLRHLFEMSSSRDGGNLKFEKNSNIRIVPINILLMEYYDGIQLFKKSPNIFCPLMISILNLPPALRKVVNYGMFTISVFTGGNKDEYNPTLSNVE